jgi:hypothetical protein
VPHQDDQTTTEALEGLFARYAKRGAPIQVNFRRLVPWLGSAERSTHLIHPYPAKLLMHIPFFFLANEVLSRRGDTVLDPFAGAGTVLLESILAGRTALGADANAVARLITRAKTTPLPPPDLHAALAQILVHTPANGDPDPPDVVNITRWYYPHVIRQLARLRTAIDQVTEAQIRDFFLVCFSVCARRVSLADPRLSVPVRLRTDQYPEGHPLRERTAARLRRLKRVNVSATFREVAEANADRMRALYDDCPSAAASVVCSDARSLCQEYADGAPLPDGSAQLIITSPPYPGAQKYTRSTSLSLGWLGLCSQSAIRAQKAKEIGREQYRKAEYESPESQPVKAAEGVLEAIRSANPLRAHICSRYLCEMRDAIAESARILRPGGYCVLVAGNSRVCRREFRTADFLATIARQAGLSPRLELVDDIRSRGLMTKRNQSAGMILRESVMVFEK